jgi:hypothetical protein
MQAEIDKDKRLALSTLKNGLADGCADDLTEVMINLENGTCDYVELIPALEEVARVEWFHYFDDNGAGGLPRPDMSRKSSFKAWALKAIENIRKNATFESSSMIHNALKSNNTALIKNTLEQLKANRIADKSLIPILEKIAQKDVYNKYSYLGSFEVDCKLGELAREVIAIIVQPPASDIQDQPTSVTMEYTGNCSVCSSLPDDITVNTGREEYFPSAFNQLVGMDDDQGGEFRRCPGCQTYFNWIDMRQMYGSGNNDEERLVRLSQENSRLLDKLFTADSTSRPTSTEIEEYLRSLPLELLLKVLRFHLYDNRDFVKPFIPHLVRLLGKSNDTSLWALLNGYVSKTPERAQEILDAFSSSDGYPPNRLIQLLHHCLKLLKGKIN